MVTAGKNMFDDVSDIEAFYNASPNEEHVRLERHQLEYDLTWRYLDRFLPTQGSILEVGAATGRYSLELVKRGYQLTAVDLSPGLIEVCRKNIMDAGLSGKARFLVADARDLSGLQEEKFDVVLLMGPLYHLVEETDREHALKQAYEHLREGGVIFTAFISRLGVFGDLMKNMPHWIEDQAEVKALLDKGRRPDDRPHGGFRGYFALASEISSLHEEVGFETLVLAGVEPAISADDESYNKLRDNQRESWLNLLFKISTDESILAASRHLLYIGRKPKYPA
jgi:S-adenosylmethionine-dependent methyltransferase